MEGYLGRHVRGCTTGSLHHGLLADHTTQSKVSNLHVSGGLLRGGSASETERERERENAIETDCAQPCS
jgi:hypothetical protein